MSKEEWLKKFKKEFDSMCIDEAAEIPEEVWENIKVPPGLVSQE